MTGPRPARWLTADRTAVVVVLLLVFLVAMRPAVDNDLWFHLRTGQWMVDHHSFVHADPFNQSRPDVVRVQTDWIGQLILYGLWSLGGGTLVALYVAVLATAGTAMILVATRGPLVTRLYVVALAAAASSLFWAARTQMATFVLTAVTIAALRRWRATPQRWWWLVPMFGLWANLHGGVTYGVAVLWATVVGEAGNRVVRRVEPLDRAALRTLALVAAACTAAIAVNPSGPRIYTLPLHQLTSSVRFVQEVQPPSISDPAAWPFFALLVLTFGALVLGRRRLDLADVILVLGVGILALRVVRLVSFFATVAAPVLATHVGHIVERRRAEPPAPRELHPAFCAGAIAAVAVVVAASTAHELDSTAVARRLAADYPVAATDWLNDHHPPTELFNSFDWGGYLMFFAPEYKVAIDGRTDIYDDFVSTYADVVAVRPGWDTELDREGTNTVVIETASPLARALIAAGGWTAAYSDAVAIVLVRDEPISPPPSP